MTVRTSEDEAKTMSSNEVPGAISSWRKIKEIADRIQSRYADKIYVAKEYTKADLRRDLLATIPESAREV
jgi:hypothetical protein